MKNLTENQKKRLRERIEMGERLDEVLKDGLRQQNTPKASSPREAVLTGLISLLLALGGLAFIIFIFMSDWSLVPGVSGKASAELGLKSVAAIAVVLGYMVARRWIIDLVFPSVDREIIKTIYKVSPEVSGLQHSVEQEDIALNKHKLTHYMMMLGFFLALVVFLATNPTAIAFTFGILIDGSIGATVIQLILGLFAIGIYLSIRVLIRTHKEYDSLQEMSWRMQQMTHGLSDIQKLQTAIPTDKHCLGAEKLRAISRIIKIKGHITPEDVRDHSFDHTSIGSLLPYFITSAMPILGLIGTILGLTISIGGFEEVLQASISDKSNFAKSIGTSVGGIGTAFYTTLAGTFGMLGLKFFNMVTANARQNFLVDMNNIITVEVIPRLKSTAAWLHRGEKA